MAEKGRKSAFKSKSDREYNFCSNPFKSHGKTRSNCHILDRKVIDAAKTIKIPLNTNQKLCAPCRNIIMKQSKTMSQKSIKPIKIEEMEVEQAVPMELGGDASYAKSQEGSDQESSTDNSGDSSKYSVSIKLTPKIWKK